MNLTLVVVAIFSLILIAYDVWVIWKKGAEHGLDWS